MARNRKTLVIVTGVMAVFLALASVAYACVIFKGDLQITSPSGSGNKVTGDGAAHGYCPGGGATTAAKAKTGDTVTVQIGPATQCKVVPSNKLDAVAQEVRIRNISAYVGVDGTQWSMIQGMGCWAGSSTQVGSVTPDPSGNGNTSFTMASLTANLAGTASNLCVGKAVLNAGIMAPLVVL